MSETSSTDTPPSTSPPLGSSVIETERQKILDAKARGGLATLACYAKLSGPGWLQSALTLGGGSLGSSLYLGILAGVSMIWLQPFAMILGVIMLSAISYITLSTDERPFQAINRHINPVLGWSWLIASLMANMVWSMPQYSLCFAVMEQNLLPGVVTDTDASKWTISVLILLFCTAITWSYGSGSIGVKIYEATLKIVVAVIVLCFFGVVIRMGMSGDGIDWGSVFSGLIPRPHHLFRPAETWAPLLEAITDPAARDYWSSYIVSQQRDVMLSAGAAAVGINMTFLMPYNLLSRKWDQDFRGLTIFDLSTGMFIPFVMATSCIVIAAATQFHAKLPEGVQGDGTTIVIPDSIKEAHGRIMKSRIAAAAVDEATLPAEPSSAEQQIAATLVKRDTGALADSLQQLFATDTSDGRFFSNIIFGFGVVAMTLSSISLMQLISGFIVCEVCGVEPKGWLFRLGCLASANGALWPLIWAGGAKAWLTVVAGVFGAMLLPIAYVTFYLMMNQKTLMGDQRPRGGKRFVWNTLMGFAAVAATGAGVTAVLKKGADFGSSQFGVSWGGYAALGAVVAYILLVLFVQFTRNASNAAVEPTA